MVDTKSAGRPETKGSDDILDGITERFHKTAAEHDAFPDLLDSGSRDQAEEIERVVAPKNTLIDSPQEGLKDYFFETYGFRILCALRRIIRSVDIYSRKLSAEHQITGPQLVCLHSVVSHDGLTLSELAEEVSLSSSTMIGIVDRLEARGFVSRKRDQPDRRKVRICATEEGREAAVKAPSLLQDRFADGLRELPEIEQAAIALSLERVVELMEAKHLEASPLLAQEPADPNHEKDGNHEHVD